MLEHTRFPQLRARQAAEAQGIKDPAPDPATQRAFDLDQEALEHEVTGHGTNKPASDERLKSTFHKRLQRVVYGKIVYSTPYTNWYRVQLEELEGDWAACRMTETAVQPFSVRDISPLPPNTPVLVWKDDSVPYVVILGALPTITVDGQAVHPDWISQGSGAGFKREAYYRDIPRFLNRDGSLIDFSNNRPVDATAMGEWGRFTDLGGGIFMDALMSFLRTDESCGIWFHYMDRLARLTANNLDIRTSISELAVRLDEGEGDSCAGVTPYPYEALGAFLFGTQVHREIDDDAVHFSAPYGKFEPALDEQQPFYRYEEFKGYLGQAYMRHVTLPPQPKSGITPDEYSELYLGLINTFSNTDSRVGVFREQIALDGSWAVESAQSIAIMKRVLIPIPKRIANPEDPTGDTQENYKFAGIHGDGDEHKIQAIPEATDELPNLLTAAAMNDIMAYAFNWKSLHPFHYHKKDFDLPEESDIFPLESLQVLPAFGSLNSKMWLDRPEPVTLGVDHRYSAAYYESQAGFFITPDGSIVIRDAYGFELKTSGGSAQMSAPGDLWLQAGRSNIQYSGDDHIVKANKSVDITASQNDVRLKANRNMDLLSGADGKIGRMLIENQASSPRHGTSGQFGEDIRQAGIIFKARNSEIINWAGDIYLRTGGGDVRSGQITFDADKGKQGLRIIASDLVAFLNTRAAFTFDNQKVVHQFTQSRVDFDSQLNLNGGLIVGRNGAIINGSVSIIGGVASTGNPGGDVGTLTSSGREDIRLALQQIREDLQVFADQLSDDFNSKVTEKFHDEKKPGNDQVIDETEFSFRTESQMGTSDFVLPENYWQQLARLSENAPAVWQEPTITYQGLTQMPHPGKKKWQESDTFYGADLKLHSVNDGLDVDRGFEINPYEEPNLENWNKQVPDGNYPIIS